MNKITIKSGKLNKIFLQLKDTLGGDLSKTEGLQTLDMETNIGTGTIKGMQFKGGISLLMFDISFTDDLAFSIKSPATSPVYFTYCLEGGFKHSFNESHKTRSFEKFQAGIIVNKNEDTNVLNFKKDIHLKACLITVNTTSLQATERKDLNYKIRKTFFDSKENSYAYVSSYNLKIAELVKQFENLEEEGLVYNIMSEGLVHMIIAQELRQHKEDLANVDKNKGSLTTREMEAIKGLSDFIQKNPEKQMSVKFLCRKIGVSPRKLQEGFKLMHDTTVTDYIRDVRITKAEDLIKNTDLNISEVVYSIGITSRSYFSKIFKQKYNCCPKHYKDRYNSLAATA